MPETASFVRNEPCPRCGAPHSGVIPHGSHARRHWTCGTADMADGIVQSHRCQARVEVANASLDLNGVLALILEMPSVPWTAAAARILCRVQKVLSAPPESVATVVLARLARDLREGTRHDD